LITAANLELPKKRSRPPGRKSKFKLAQGFLIITGRIAY
jgi:hypothetical protein